MYFSTEHPSISGGHSTQGWFTLCHIQKNYGVRLVLFLEVSFACKDALLPLQFSLIACTSLELKTPGSLNIVFHLQENLSTTKWHILTFTRYLVQDGSPNKFFDFCSFPSQHSFDNKDLVFVCFLFLVLELIRTKEKELDRTLGEVRTWMNSRQVKGNNRTGNSYILGEFRTWVSSDNIEVSVGLPISWLENFGRRVLPPVTVLFPFWIQ